MSLVTQPSPSPRPSAPHASTQTVPTVLGNGVGLLLNPLRVWLRQVSTPTLLQLFLGATWVSVLLFWGAVYTGVDVYRQGYEQIGRDTVPVAMQTHRLRTRLSALDASATRLLLLEGRTSSDVEARAAHDSYDARRADFADALISSAEHLSSDVHDRALLVQLQAQVERYEALIGRAIALQELAANSKSQIAANNAYQDARNQIDIAIDDTLSQIQGVEDVAYDTATFNQNTAQRSTILKIISSGVLALAVLTLAQFALFGRTRRILNPGLATATVLTVALLWWAIAVFGGVTRNLANADRQGSFASGQTFASLQALAVAREKAQSARAHESRALLAEDGGMRQSFLSQFNVDVSALVSALSSPTNSRLDYTSPLSVYASTHQALIERLPENKSARSVGSDLSLLLASNDQTFSDLDGAISDDTTTFQEDFQTSLAANLNMLRIHEIITSLLALTIAAAALLGIVPRLREYTF